jgi:flagellar basal body-associated protein FliL
MDKTVKALIIVVIILVAVLGVAGGFILQGYMSNSNKNITVNQTNASVNNTTTVQTTKQFTI